MNKGQAPRHTCLSLTGASHLKDSLFVTSGSHIDYTTSNNLCCPEDLALPSPSVANSTFHGPSPTLQKRRLNISTVSHRVEDPEWDPGSIPLTTDNKGVRRVPVEVQVHGCEVSRGLCNNLRCCKTSCFVALESI